jgi:hypothetical protein
MVNIQNIFYKYINDLELLIAAYLSCTLVITGIQTASVFFTRLGQSVPSAAFTELLGNVFMLIIGLEFIRMILKPTSGNVLEVVLFTAARSLVLDHSSMLECLAGVLALGVLFAVKKYLFVEINPKEDERAAFPPLHAARGRENAEIIKEIS